MVFLPLGVVFYNDGAASANGRKYHLKRFKGLDIQKNIF